MNGILTLDDISFFSALYLCMGYGAGVVSNIKISLDISECPKVSV